MTKPENSLIAEDDFSIKIRIIFKLFLSPIHEHTTLLVIKRLQFLRQFDFVRIQAKIISQNSLQRRHRDAQCLKRRVRDTFGLSSQMPRRQQYSRHWYGNILYCTYGFKFFHQTLNGWTGRTIITTIYWTQRS